MFWTVRYIIIILGWVKVHIYVVLEHSTDTDVFSLKVVHVGTVYHRHSNYLLLLVYSKEMLKNICAEYRLVVWHCYLLVSLLYFVLLNTLYKFDMTLVLIYMYICKLQNYFFSFFYFLVFFVWIVKYIVCLAAVGSQHDGQLPSCSLAFVLFYCLYFYLYLLVSNKYYFPTLNQRIYVQNLAKWGYKKWLGEVRKIWGSGSLEGAKGNSCASDDICI